MSGKMERKPLDKPDETRPFKNGKGKLDVVTVGGHTFGRGEFEPGWRWSEHVKPIAGTPSCQAAHTGYVLKGRMVVKMDDGAQVDSHPLIFWLSMSGNKGLLLGLSEKNQDGLATFALRPEVTDRLQRAGKSRISQHPRFARPGDGTESDDFVRRSSRLR